MKDRNLLSVYFGFAFWLLFLFLSIPYSIFELTHVQILLLAAPLWIIPLSWRINNSMSWKMWISLAAGILFAGSFLLFPGHSAALMTIPWLILTSALALEQLRKIRSLPLTRTLELAAHLYLPVGAAWAFCDRLGFTPFGYSPTIVLLTAVHFHYAGFLLPQITSYLFKNKKSTATKILSFAIIAGVPLVAIGISASHFQWPSIIEVICVSILTSAGILLGALHITQAFSINSLLPKILFIIGGAALIIGMLLALTYGWRSLFTIEILTIPWMYAVHGTCNAIGFAAPIIIGNYLLRAESENAPLTERTL